jgi:hypothetical protein
MFGTRENWRKDWFKALFDSYGNEVAIRDFDRLYIHEGPSRKLQLQFPNGGDFWLVYTDTDPATYPRDQIKLDSRSSGVVLICTKATHRWLLPNKLSHVGYIQRAYGTVEETIQAYLSDPTLPSMPATVQDIVREKLHDRANLI